MNDKNQIKLYSAINEGDVDEVRILLEQGTTPDGTDPTKWTPLMNAAELGNLEIIKLLLSYGAEINHADQHGMTPLHIAVDIAIDGTLQTRGILREEPTEIIRFLLDSGADMNVKDIRGETPLDWSQKYQSEKISTLLNKHSK